MRRRPGRNPRNRRRYHSPDDTDSMDDISGDTYSDYDGHSPEEIIEIHEEDCDCDICLNDPMPDDEMYDYGPEDDLAYLNNHDLFDEMFLADDDYFDPSEEGYIEDHPDYYDDDFHE